MGLFYLGEALNLFLFRLLKEMGWQEDSENDETCAPLTEDEMREFQVISEQVRTESYKFTLNCPSLIRKCIF